MWHDPEHALGEDGQHHAALLALLGLVDHAVVEADDQLEELVVAALLRHVLIEHLKGFDDGLVVVDLSGGNVTSVKRSMTSSTTELKGWGLRSYWLWMRWVSSRRKSCLLGWDLKGKRTRVRRWLNGLLLLFIMSVIFLKFRNLYSNIYSFAGYSDYCWE